MQSLFQNFFPNQTKAQVNLNKKLLRHDKAKYKAGQIVKLQASTKQRAGALPRRNQGGATTKPDRNEATTKPRPNQAIPKRSQDQTKQIATKPRPNRNQEPKAKSEERSQIAITGQSQAKPDKAPALPDRSEAKQAKSQASQGIQSPQASAKPQLSEGIYK